MPHWILPIEKGSLSFKASKDLYDKFLGIALSFVADIGHHDFKIALSIDGKQWSDRPIESSHSLDLDHVALLYFRPSQLWRAIDFGQIDRNDVEFGVTLCGESVKKWGSRIICKHLRDDLKAKLQDNRLIDLALLYEVGHESTDSAAESLLMHEDNLSKAIDRGLPRLSIEHQETLSNLP